MAIYVSPSGQDADGNGARDRPYRTIQFAIDAAASGSLVVVLPGTYLGTGNRDIRFRGKALAVRSEEGADVTILDAERSSTVFVFDAGETRESVLEGVTIQGGRDAYVSPFGGGGGAGIRILNSSPVVRDCIIRLNQSNGASSGVGSAPGEGAGILIRGGSPAFENCTIRENTANGPSGGSWTGLAWKWPGKGAGVWASNAVFVMRNCRITDNEAVYGYGSSGSSESEGGGLRLENSDCVLDGCTISSNRATYHGIQVRGGRTLLSNCTLAFNENGALGAIGGVVHLEHCTLAFNETHSSYAGILAAHSTSKVTVRNSIFVANRSDYGQIGGDTISLGHNILSDNLGGAGLLSSDRVTTETVLADLAEPPPEGAIPPIPGGPAIDAGVVALPLVEDQLGFPRNCDGDGDGRRVPDIGAVELQGTSCGPNELPSALFEGILDDVNRDGVLDVADLVGLRAWAGSLPR